MKTFSLKESRITDGFWANRQKINAENTIPAVYNRFKETGRFDALKCEKKETPSHVFWDSDAAKWLESAAYLLSRKEDKQIRAWYDEAVEDICKNQREDGYFNSYFQVYAPEKIFTARHDHELYCAGHLFEAAVAGKKYLNDDRLLKFSEKYVDYIYERFVEKQDTAFLTPGHQEIELALLKLYELTGKEKYKELSSYFLEKRANNEKDLNDDILERWGGIDITLTGTPIRKQTEAFGHAVRAMYLYIAMADMARITGDEELRKVTERLFESVTENKMYITGGIGSTNHAERFTVPYHLPNETSYAETCAAVGLAFFCDRMQKLTGEAKYGHVFERVLYNGILSGISLDGESFFYVNHMEFQTSCDLLLKDGRANPNRQKVFNTSCCPPNISRFIEQLPSFIWYADEEKNELILSQYISSSLSNDFVDASITSSFPQSGKVCVKVNSKGKNITLKLRIPHWCDKKFENAKDGYLVYEGVFNGEEICVDFDMRVRRTFANAHAWENTGKTAVTYGPIVLCAEGQDNDVNLGRIAIGCTKDAVVEKTDDDFAIRVTIPAYTIKNAKSLYTFDSPEYEEHSLRMVPYFTWSNRGVNDMRIWFSFKR
ncbi:MAG: glycoside hydrolase family 127 protein [Clostridiales bacterium]|nr:glycoside hydrolase family 127 protein [Clostridiales bacterium]